MCSGPTSGHHKSGLRSWRCSRAQVVLHAPHPHISAQRFLDAGVPHVITVQRSGNPPRACAGGAGSSLSQDPCLARARLSQSWRCPPHLGGSLGASETALAFEKVSEAIRRRIGVSRARPPREGGGAPRGGAECSPGGARRARRR